MLRRSNDRLGIVAGLLEVAPLVLRWLDGAQVQIWRRKRSDADGISVGVPPVASAVAVLVDKGHRTPADNIVAEVDLVKVERACRSRDHAPFAVKAKQNISRLDEELVMRRLNAFDSFRMT
eukprot:c20585_g5_i8.p2 GENE.c20585_g5_i8~~c20585_g5_i8.p2  ORF type:complete len:121 (-),score=0.57 c20585_g5_i8:579-941(-)